MPLPFLLLTINGQVDFDQITTPHSLWDDDFKDYQEPKPFNTWQTKLM